VAGSAVNFYFNRNHAGIAGCNAMKFPTVGATIARSGPFSNGPKIHSFRSTFKG
jgi:hypothetical protein